MGGRLTYLVLGDGAAPDPVQRWPRAPARIAAIYRARVQAIREARGEFVCWADGGEDHFAAAWPAVCDEIIERMQASGAAIGYCDETRSGVPHIAGPWSLARALEHPQMIHHAAICRLSALQAIYWPDGCFNWETLAYHHLARTGWVYVPRVGYHWTPTPGGAHSWGDTARGVVNALLHLQDRPGVHFDQDLLD